MPAVTRRWNHDPEGWVASYRPKTVDQSLWDGQLGEFVREALGRLLGEGHGSLTRTATALSGLASWSYQRGTPLDWELILDPLNVEQYAQTLGREWAGDYRSVLRRAGRALTRIAPWDPKPAVAKRRTVPPPYTSDELVRLEADAASQATAHRQRGFETLLVLGLGAGLDGRWAGAVRGVDVHERDGGLLVAVGEPAARLVPARDAYAGRLHTLAKDAGAELLLGGRPRPNRVSDVRGRLELGQHTPPVDPGRLRSTWMLAQLRARTDLGTLADTAGLAGLTTISDLLAYLPRPDREHAWAQLRGT